MTNPREKIEYGYAYWVEAREGGNMFAATFFGALTGADLGTKIVRPASQSQLEYENELGQDGWVIWRYWEPIRQVNGIPWPREQLRESFPDFAHYEHLWFFAQYCRVRRGVWTQQ